VAGPRQRLSDPRARDAAFELTAHAFGDCAWGTSACSPTASLSWSRSENPSMWPTCVSSRPHGSESSLLNGRRGRPVPAPTRLGPCVHLLDPHGPAHIIPPDRSRLHLPRVTWHPAAGLKNPQPRPTGAELRRSLTRRQRTRAGAFSTSRSAPQVAPIRRQDRRPSRHSIWTLLGPPIECPPHFPPPRTSPEMPNYCRAGPPPASLHAS